MSQDVIVNLGRRLVDVRFFHGHTDSAIDLAEDILYNMRQVYGPSHPSAVQMMNLLSSIYMSKGDRAAAMAVHASAHPGITKTSLDDRRDDVVLGDRSPDDRVIRSKIERLLQQYQHSDGPEKSRRPSSTLVDGLAKRFNVPAADAKSAAIREHQLPSTWSFAEGGDEDQSVRVSEWAR